MSNRDPAFLWETEAMRSAAHRIAEAELDEANATGDSRWATLREASRATGIPVETLRKWARRGSVPSYLSPTDRRTSLRMVDLDAIRQRADELGRHDSSVQPTPAQQSDRPIPAADMTGTATPDVPPGSMIVPVDAWNKMLNQLGNLHEAGQQLAEARERAAKAETEARFLRERLAELRELEHSPSAEPATEAHSESASAQRAAPPTHQIMWRYVVSRWRDRKRG